MTGFTQFSSSANILTPKNQGNCRDIRCANPESKEYDHLKSITNVLDQSREQKQDQQAKAENMK